MGELMLMFAAIIKFIFIVRVGIPALFTLILLLISIISDKIDDKKNKWS